MFGRGKWQSVKGCRESHRDLGTFNSTKGSQALIWGQEPYNWGKDTNLFCGGSPKVWGMLLRPPLVGTESVGGGQQPPAGLETPPPPAFFQEQLGPAWVVLLGSW